MAKYHGNGGSLSAAGSTVASVLDWELEETEEFADQSGMGDTVKTFLAGAPSEANFACNCHYNKGDTGQDAIVVGASIAVIVYPGGNSSGLPSITFTVLVGSVKRNGNMSETVKKSITGIVTGAITEADVS